MEVDVGQVAALLTSGTEREVEPRGLVGPLVPAVEHLGQGRLRRVAVLLAVVAALLLDAHRCGAQHVREVPESAEGDMICRQWPTLCLAIKAHTIICRLWHTL